MKRCFALFLAICFVISFLPVTAMANTGFSDMPEAGYWSTAALEAAVDNGLLNGSGGQLKPLDYLKRSQMAAIIGRAFGAIAEASLSAFTDVPSNAWYTGDMAKAVDMGIFQGDTSGKLRPDDNITRQEAFAVLARALKVTGGALRDLAKFADADQVADWAQEPLASLVKAAYVQGSNGKLNPRSNISREEFAQVMYNVIKQYISTPGTYNKSITGNVMVRTHGVVLKDMAIKGDLFVGEGVAKGSVQLDNVQVAGRIVVRGGGADEGLAISGESTVGEILISNKYGVAIDIDEDVTVGIIRVETNNAVINVANATVVVAAGVTGTVVNGTAMLGGETKVIEKTGGSGGTGGPGGSDGPGGPGDPGTPSEVPSTALAISPAAASVIVGTVRDLTLTRKPNNANDSVTWASSDDSIASVSSTGRISARRTGEVTVTATSAGGILASATVYIVAPADGADVVITEPGTVLNGGNYASVTIAASVGSGDVTLVGVVAGTLTVNGGGKNTVELQGGQYDDVNLNQTPSEGTRILTSGGVVIDEINIGEGATNAVIETQSGSNSTIGAIDASAPLNLVNTSAPGVTTTDNLYLTGSSVVFVETTGTTELSMDPDSAVNSVDASGDVTISGGVIDTINATGDLTIGSDTTVGTIIASGDANITASGSVGVIEGASLFGRSTSNRQLGALDVGGVNVALSGNAAPLLLGALNNVNVSGNAFPTIGGAASNVVIAAASGGSPGVTVAGSGDVDNISTIGDGNVGAINVQNGSPDVSIGSGTSVNQIAVSGPAAPMIGGTGSVGTLVSSSTGQTACTAPTGTVLTTPGTVVTAPTTVQTTTITLESIAITNYPTKLIYKTTDTEFVKTGMVVTGYYRVSGFDGVVSRALADKEWTHNLADISKTAGVREITIKETSGKTAKFPVTFVDKTVHAITIKALPTKLTYDIGSNETTLDHAGGAIDVIYTNSALFPNEEVPMSAVTLSGFVAEVGTKTITVTYSGKTTVFTVTVKNSLADAKAAAVTDLKLYAADKLFENTYSQAGRQAINNALAAGQISIGNATSTGNSTDPKSVAYTLAAAKTAIDAVKTQDAEWNEKAAAYTAEYNEALSLSTEDVQIEDRAIITAAKNALAGLETGVQSKLKTQKNLLDSLLAKIASLEAAQTLEAAKEKAAKTVNDVFNTYHKSDVSYASTDYITENYTALTNAKNAGLERIGEAESVVAVVAAQNTALDAMAAIKSNAVLLAEGKQEAVTSLNNYYPKGITAALYNGATSPYDAAGKAQVEKLRTDGIAAIYAAASPESVIAALNQSKGSMDAVKTIAEVAAEKLLATKQAAKNELAAYGTINLYRENEKTQFQNAKLNGNNQIDAAASINQVAEALAAAKVVINSIKTAAQFAAEELSAAKVSAKEVINVYLPAGKTINDYSATGRALISALKASRSAEVDRSTSIEALETIVQNAKTEINAVDTLQTEIAKDLNAAESALSNATFPASTTQAAHGTEALLKAYLKGIVDTAIANNTILVTVSGTYTAPIAGDAEDTDGTDGSYTSIRITLTKGGQEKNFDVESIVIEATRYDGLSNAQAVAEAKAIIEAATYSVKQSDINTEAALENWLSSHISDLAGFAAAGVAVSPSDIEITAFTAAAEGTFDDQDGTNGGFRFTVSLTKGSASATTMELSGVISATPYAPVPSEAKVAVTTFDQLKDALSNPVVESININAIITISSDLTADKEIVVNTGKTLTIAEGITFDVKILVLDGGHVVNNGTIHNHQDIIVDNKGSFTNNGTVNNKGTIFVYTVLDGADERGWIKSELTGSKPINNKDENGEEIGYIAFIATVDSELELRAANASQEFNEIYVVAEKKPETAEQRTITLTQDITINKSLTIWRIIFDGMEASEPMILTIAEGAKLTMEGYLKLYGTLNIQGAPEGEVPGSMIIEGGIVFGANAALTNDGKLIAHSTVDINSDWVGEPKELMRGSLTNNGEMVMIASVNVHGILTNNGTILISGYIEELDRSGNLYADDGLIVNNGTIKNNADITLDNGSELINNKDAEILNKDGVINVYALRLGGAPTWFESSVVNSGKIDSKFSYEAWTDSEVGLRDAAGDAHFNRISLVADSSTENMDGVEIALTDDLTIDKPLTIWRYRIDGMTASAPVKLIVGEELTLKLNDEVLVYGELINHGTASMNAMTEIGSNGTIENRGILELSGDAWIGAHYEKDEDRFYQGDLINFGDLTISGRTSFGGGILTNNADIIIAENGELQFFGQSEYDGSESSTLTNIGWVRIWDSYGPEGNFIFALPITGLTNSSKLELYAEVHTLNGLKAAMAADKYVAIDVLGNIALDASITVKEGTSLNVDGDGAVLIVGDGVTLTNYGFMQLRNGGGVKVEDTGKVVNHGAIETWYGWFECDWDNEESPYEGNEVVFYANRADLARELYRGLRFGYGLETVSQEDIDAYAEQITDWYDMVNKEKPKESDFDGMEAFAFLLKNGIIDTFGDGGVHPYEYVNRAEVAVVLDSIVTKLQQKGTIDGELATYIDDIEVSYNDVDENEENKWFYGALVYLTKSQIFDPDEDYFRPYDPIVSTWYPDRGSDLENLIKTFVEAIGLDPSLSNVPVTTYKQLRDALDHPVVTSVNIDADITITSDYGTDKEIVINPGKTLTIDEGVEIDLAVLWVDGGTLVNNGTINIHQEIGVDNNGAFINNGHINNWGAISVNTELVGTDESKWLSSVFENNGTLDHHKDDEGNDIGHISWIATVDSEAELRIANGMEEFNEISIAASGESKDAVVDTLTITSELTIKKTTTIWRYIFDGMEASKPMIVNIAKDAELTMDGYLRLYGTLNILGASASDDPGSMIINGGAVFGASAELTNNGTLVIKSTVDVNSLFVEETKELKRGHLTNNGEMVIDGSVNVHGLLSNNGHIVVAAYNEELDTAGNIYVDEGEVVNDGTIENYSDITLDRGILRNFGVLDNQSNINVDVGTLVNEESGTLMQNGYMSFTATMYGTDREKWFTEVFINDGVLEGNTDNIFYTISTDNKDGLLAAALNEDCDSIDIKPDPEATPADILDVIRFDSADEPIIFNADVTIWRYRHVSDPEGTPSTPMKLIIGEEVSVTFKRALRVYGELENNGTMVANGDVQIGANGTITNKGSLESNARLDIDSVFSEELDRLLRGELVNTGTLTNNGILASHGGRLTLTAGTVTNNESIEVRDMYYAGPDSSLYIIQDFDPDNVSEDGKIDWCAVVFDEAGLRAALVRGYDWIDVERYVEFEITGNLLVNTRVNVFESRLILSNGTLTVTENGSLSLREDGGMIIGEGGQVVNNGFIETWYGWFDYNPHDGSFTGNEVITYANRSDIARELYNRLRDGYGFAGVTMEDDIEAEDGYAAKFSDWKDMSGDTEKQLALAFLLKNEIIVGYKDGTIRPREYITRAEAVALLEQVVNKLQQNGTIVDLATYKDDVEVKYNDAKASDWFYSGLEYLTKSGVVSGDEHKNFRPYDPIGSTWYEDWGSELVALVDTFVEAIGAVPSVETEYTVNLYENLEIRNKKFDELVTITCESNDEDGNYGGRIDFVDCRFDGGLLILLGDKQFEVGLDGSVFGEGSKIRVEAADHDGLDRYRDEIRVEIRDVMRGTVIDSEVPIYVSGSKQDSGFTLNGVTVTGMKDLEDEDKDDFWFNAGLIWDCAEPHDEDFNWELGDHRSCGGFGYQTIHVNGRVASIDASSETAEALKFRLDEECREDVTLKLGTIEVDRAYLNGGKNASLIVEGAVISGDDKNGELEVTGRVDISSEEMTVDGRIIIGTWEEFTDVNIGGKTVYIEGGEERNVNIAAGSGARVILTQENHHVNLRKFVGDVEHVFDVQNPHVFNDQPDCQVFIDTDNLDDYSYELAQWLYNDEIEGEELDPIAFDVDESYLSERKIHLVPETEILNPYGVQLTVTWGKEDDAITVVYERLHRRETQESFDGPKTYTVNSMGHQMIRNKVFNGMVTVTSDESGEGGLYSVDFEDCVFNEGLTILSGSKSYSVDLHESTVITGKTIQVNANPEYETNIYNSFENIVALFGIGDQANIVATVPITVSTRKGESSFYLNGIRTTSKNFTDLPEDQQWGIASVYWECGDEHEPGFRYEDMLHPDCDVALAYPSYTFNGQIETVDFAGAHDMSLVVWMNNSVSNLNLGGKKADILRVNATGEGYLKVSGSLEGVLELVGKADLSDASVIGRIDIETWRDNTDVLIGGNTIHTVGTGRYPINISASNGAMVIVTDPIHQFNINDDGSGNGFDIQNPHVFGDQPSCQVYVDTANTVDYTYTLEQWARNDESGKDELQKVDFTIDETYVGMGKLHLVPDDEIVNPSGVMLTVTWKTGDDTITVVFDRVERKETTEP